MANNNKTKRRYYIIWLLFGITAMFIVDGFEINENAVCSTNEIAKVDVDGKWSCENETVTVITNSTLWLQNNNYLYPSNLSNYVGIGTTAPNQDLQVIGNINVSGTIYYGALTANSPHALMPDESGHTQICLVADNGKVVMQYLKWTGTTYEWAFEENAEPCLNKEIVTDMDRTYENQTRIENVTKSVYTEVYNENTKETEEIESYIEVPTEVTDQVLISETPIKEQLFKDYINIQTITK